MKTGDLIELLAADAPATPSGTAWRRLMAAWTLGGAATLALVAIWLRCQPLAAAAAQPWFWMKTSYTGLLALAGLVLVRRLSSPGAPLRAVPWLALAVIAGMAALGGGQIVTAPPGAGIALWLGQTWKLCSPLILLLALPIHAALAIAVRSLAPTRLVAAGAATGFAAGALAATLYGLHCPEQGAAFVATWYSLGIAAATAFGALTARRLLRW